MSGRPDRGRGGRGDRGGGRGRGDGAFRGASRGTGDNHNAPRGGFQGPGNNHNAPRAGFQGPGDNRDAPRGSFQRGRGGNPRGNFGDQHGRGGTQSTPHNSGGGSALFQKPGHAGVPDPAVTAKENEDILVVDRKPIDEGLPLRPDYGTQGKKTVLFTNYFHLKVNEDKTFFRYSVTFPGAPENGLSRYKRRVLFKQLRALPCFADITLVSDSSSLLVSLKKLDLGPAERLELSLSVSDPVDSRAQNGNARAAPTQRVALELTGRFSPTQLLNYLQARAVEGYLASKNDIVQILNIVIANHPDQQPNAYQMGSSKKFFIDTRETLENADLGGGLRALRGYYASVRPATSRILVNLNTASGAFYKPIKLQVLLNEFLNGHGLGRNNAGYRQAESFIRRLKIETNYIKAKNPDGTNDPEKTVLKVKTIVSFARDQNGNYTTANKTFFQLNGTAQNISVHAYFQATYPNSSHDPTCLVVNVGSERNPVYLPMDVCEVLPGQAFKKLLSAIRPDQIKQMLEFAAKAPNINARYITSEGLDMFALRDPTTLQPFGLSLNTNLITVEGRVLDAPTLTYKGENDRSKDVRVIEGSWNLAQVKFFTGGAFRSWACLIIRVEEADGADPPRGSGLPAEEICTRLAEQLHQRGVRVGDGQRPPPMLRREDRLRALNSANRDFNDAKLDKVFELASRNRTQVLFIILQKQDKWLYSRIKYYGDVKYGIHTINCVGSKIDQNSGAHMGNLALKFNIKGNGINHCISLTGMAPLDMDTMLVGIDVTHPSPGSADGAPSIAGIVASVDQHLCQWPGSIRMQTGRTEMVQELKAMVIERLRLWRGKHRRFPTKIIVYRDGVSEGQYKVVLDNELPAFNAAFEELYGETPPKLAIIIVGKRHHTRFYPTETEYTDTRSFNPRPGTVVDRGITDAYLYDFYLQAHKGIKGTARPAHYVVIYDKIGFRANELEKFTHSMCYLFNRATKAVSICPPAYYADLLCERGRMYMFRTLNENHGAAVANAAAAVPEWDGTIHANLRNSTFYI